MNLRSGEFFVDGIAVIADNELLSVLNSDLIEGIEIIPDLNDYVQHLDCPLPVRTFLLLQNGQ
ncbi:MAG: hypothetical protein ACFE0J_16805 [Elainellaceae cyanobacterium]